MKYSDFIKQKIAVSKLGGFDVPESELPECLMPHQKDIVRWAVRGGQRAVFASFGIGCELNTDYWHDGCKYLAEVESEIDAPTLFNMIEGARGEG